MIGNTYKRKRRAPETYPQTIRVVGTFGSEWTCTDADAFGPTFALTPTELANLYSAPTAVPEPVHEDSIRRPTRELLRAAISNYRTEPAPSNAPGPDSAPSPEDVFATQSAGGSEESGSSGV